MGFKNTKCGGGFGCWRYRSLLEKCLVIFSAATILSTISLTIALICILFKAPSTCLTPSCIAASERILRLSNITVDPCDDFLAFSCGRFLSEGYDLLERPLLESAATHLKDVIERRVAFYLETPATKGDDAKKLFVECCNLSRIDEGGLGVVKMWLLELGGWPVLMGSTWNERDSDWNNLLAQLKRRIYQESSLYTIKLDIGKLNSSQFIMSVDQAVLSLPIEVLRQGWKNPLVKNYHQYLQEMSVLFGASPSRALRAMRDVVDFEIKLSKILRTEEERWIHLDEYYNLMNVSRLEKEFSIVKWKMGLKAFLGEAHELKDEEIVNIVSIQYLKNLENLLRRTQKRIIVNYILAKTIHSMSITFPAKLRDTFTRFNAILSGNQLIEPRWKSCVEFVSRTGLEVRIPQPKVNATWIKNLKATSLNVLKEFQRTLLQSTWMDDVSKHQAARKLDLMQINVAIESNSSIIRKPYEKIKFNASNFFQTFLSVQQFLMKKSAESYGKEIDKNDLRFKPKITDVGIKYSALNSIEIPSSILQSDFYDKNRPDYINYGTFGSMLTAATFQAIDSKGRLFNGNGSFTPWMTTKNIREYNTRTKCLAAKFNIENAIVLEEVVSNIFGIQQSYKAYKRTANKKTELNLPGLEFTQKQLFWIAVAQIRCTKSKTTLSNRKLVPLETIRLIGGLRELLDDFKCPKENSDFISDDCAIW